jgi:BirA family transcriptional regulator, biotin operon repressor / biotin---[acetyl-CoA-carboxylase] ligase
MSAPVRFAHEHNASTDSTNAELLRRAAIRSVHATALSADVQTAGRGQRGRRWYAAPGDCLLLSAAWRFGKNERLDGLSLAVGVAVAHACARFAAGRVTLKWPNDLLLDDAAKLGGILIETIPDANAERTAIIGIGVNIRPPQLAAFERIGAPDALPAAALLAGFHPRGSDGAMIVRDALRQAILDELATTLPRFAREGFAAFRDAWLAHRAYANTRVRVLAGDTENAVNAGHSIGGRIVDVDASGALVIDDGTRLHTLHSGSVSIRPTLA